ncbi:ABC transporter permease [Fulvivirgaceae bacterium BMA10]|uniref:ABC transporter permease n=1 Tax=Splendidivirga corallicola TaxID=3051826 RepID=A0ABT8KMK4_9BACT|nr:ABC transporter permease [Fulvivirgaceae bacterium BMA10]
MKVVKLILESFRFAWNALKVNKLRTILSLAGVTIGIFAIIAVFTVVDSLEKSVKESFNFLGSNVINVEKWPYGLGGGEYTWWEYWRRPQPVYEEYEFLAERVEEAVGLTIYAVRGGQTYKSGSNSSTGNFLLGVSHDYKDVFEFNVDAGRYFTPQEVLSARNTVMIGHNVANELFPFGDPIGQDVKIRDHKFTVIGVMKKEGDNLLGAPSKDDACFIPYKSFLKLYYSGRRRGIGSTIAVKGYDQDIGLVELESELKGLMRRKRGLRPKQKDNFALNRTEAIANAIGGAFDVISIVGGVIGMFSILVGGFGIANIMFVSVKERTNLIGIQKSLGAKNYFVLFQFLFESVFLCIIGGLVGLIMVYLITFVPLGNLELVLSFKNIVIGIGISALIGTFAGIIPAALAARLDPVIAIRS